MRGRGPRDANSQNRCVVTAASAQISCLVLKENDRQAEGSCQIDLSKPVRDVLPVLGRAHGARADSS